MFSDSRDTKMISKRLQDEINRIKKSVYLISYGSKLNDRVSLKNIGAYNLYLISPLQTDKAQV